MNVDLEVRTAKKFLKLKQSAHSRGKSFNLSLTSVRNLLRAKKCYFTGVPLTPANMTVDRLDASKGYIIGNVVACDATFNRLKGSYDLIHLVKALKKIELTMKRG